MLDFRLFTGERISLAPLDVENDPPIMEEWTNDSAWMRICELNVIEYNTRARRLYREIGFVEEGCEREFCHRDGQRYGLVYMGLLYSDWTVAG